MGIGGFFVIRPGGPVSTVVPGNLLILFAPPFSWAGLKSLGPSPRDGSSPSSGTKIPLEASTCGSSQSFSSHNFASCTQPLCYERANIFYLKSIDCLHPPATEYFLLHRSRPENAVGPGIPAGPLIHSNYMPRRRPAPTDFQSAFRNRTSF